MFCKNCGKKIPDQAVFCPECGQEQKHWIVDRPNLSGDDRKSAEKEDTVLLKVGAIKNAAWKSLEFRFVLECIILVALFFLGVFLLLVGGNLNKGWMILLLVVCPILSLTTLIPVALELENRKAMSICITDRYVYGSYGRKAEETFQLNYGDIISVQSAGYDFVVIESKAKNYRCCVERSDEVIELLQPRIRNI